MHTIFQSIKNRMFSIRLFKDKNRPQQQEKNTEKKYWRFTRRDTVETCFVWQRLDNVRSVREPSFCFLTRPESLGDQPERLCR